MSDKIKILTRKSKGGYVAKIKDGAARCFGKTAEEARQNCIAMHEKSGKPPTWGKPFAWLSADEGTCAATIGNHKMYIRLKNGEYQVSNDSSVVGTEKNIDKAKERAYRFVNAIGPKFRVQDFQINPLTMRPAFPNGAIEQFP